MSSVILPGYQSSFQIVFFVFFITVVEWHLQNAQYVEWMTGVWQGAEFLHKASDTSVIDLTEKKFQIFCYNCVVEIRTGRQLLRMDSFQDHLSDSVINCLTPTAFVCKGQNVDTTFFAPKFRVSMFWRTKPERTWNGPTSRLTSSWTKSHLLVEIIYTNSLWSPARDSCLPNRFSLSTFIPSNRLCTDSLYLLWLKCNFRCCLQYM